MPTYRQHDDSQQYRGPTAPPAYPMVNENETITELEPKQLSDFPDPARFPPPTPPLNLPDGVVLETLWHPMWQRFPHVPVEYVMDKLTGVERRVGKVQTTDHATRGDDTEVHPEVYGCLTWPRRYHVWEIELVFASEKINRGGKLTFRVGEKNYLVMPLDSMFMRPTRAYSLLAPLLVPIFIPPNQNFTGIVEWPNLDWGHEPIGPMRFQLNGYVHRELC